VPAERGGFGAIDRVSFFAEQRRRRRQTWRLLAVCLFVVGFIGLIASTVISPIVLAMGGLLLRGAEWLAPSSPSITGARHVVAAWANRAVADLGIMADRLDQARSFGDALALLPYGAAFAGLLVPGVVATLIAYLALYALLRRSAAASIPLALNARQPKSGDFVERRLTDIVEEMALAGGLPEPQVMLVEAPVANAAAFPSSGGGAVVLVTRGLLDQLDRQETEAVIGHLVGSIGNGDWRLLCSLMAVFETLGLFLTIIDLPFRAKARRALWRLLRLVVLRASRPEESTAVAEMLAASIDTASTEETSRFLGLGQDGSRLRKVLTLPLLPLALLNILLRLVLWLWVSLLLGLVVALLWRNRRYLADASAVQLTRDPDALAGALRKLGALGGIPSGGAAVEYVFFFGPQRAAESGFGTKSGIVLPLQPPLRGRLRRVIAMGATPDARRGTAMPLGVKTALGCLMLVVAPLVCALFVAVGFLTLVVLTLASAFACLVIVWAFG
jgi:Zn-dependent protease with chaperone function